jgi:hypothetical protein
VALTWCSCDRHLDLQELMAGTSVIPALSAEGEKRRERVYATTVFV